MRELRVSAMLLALTTGACSVAIPHPFPADSGALRAHEVTLHLADGSTVNVLDPRVSGDSIVALRVPDARPCPTCDVVRGRPLPYAVPADSVRDFDVSQGSTEVTADVVLLLLLLALWGFAHPTVRGG